MSKRVLGLALIALIASGGAALAHPKMLKATPAANGVVQGSPQAIRISFNEQVAAKFSGIVLKSAAGAAVKTGDATVNPADKTELVVPVSATLAPGVYSVTWHAVAEDTHRVEGAFNFTVK